MLVFLPAVALATTGGPQNIEVLGLEPEEHKLFLMSKKEDEGGGHSRLLYYRLDAPPPEQRPDRPVQVESVYRSLGDHPAEELQRRFDRLERSLKPLAPAPLSGIEVTLTYGDQTVCDPTTAYEPVPCEQVAVTVRWAGQQATTALVTWGNFEIAGAWTVPGTDRRLVILRHSGVTTESGYDAEVPLLLEPR
jgi:hypothetical protein